MDKCLEEILKCFERLRIAVIGDAILDEYLTGNINRLNPDKKSVPLLRTGKKEREESKLILGGAANVANNIVSFSNCDFYGVVGDDEAGRNIKKLLKERGIVERLAIDSGINTILKIRFYDNDGSCLLRWDKEEENPFPVSEKSKSQILEDLQKNIGSYDAIIISDYDKGMFVKNPKNKELGSQIVALTNSRNLPIIVDAKSKNISYFNGCTVICPNRKEAGEIIGRGPLTNGELLNGGRQIRDKMRCRYVLITCDQDGVFIYNNGMSRMLKTYAREVSDHTGAGDSLTAGVALGLASGLDIYDAGDFGNRIAGLVCEKTGTAITNPREILERYKN